MTTKYCILIEMQLFKCGVGHFYPNEHDQNVVALRTVMRFDTSYDPIRPKHTHSTHTTASRRSPWMLQGTHLPAHQLRGHAFSRYFSTGIAENQNTHPAGRFEHVYQSGGTPAPHSGLRNR